MFLLHHHPLLNWLHQLWRKYIPLLYEPNFSFPQSYPFDSPIHHAFFFSLLSPGSLSIYPCGLDTIDFESLKLEPESKDEICGDSDEEEGGVFLTHKRVRNREGEVTIIPELDNDDMGGQSNPCQFIDPCDAVAMISYDKNVKTISGAALSHMGKNVEVNRRMVAHPVTGQSLALTQVRHSDPRMNEPGMFFNRLLNNSMVYLWNSVTEGSRTSYLSGWNKWCDHFVIPFGTDKFLTTTPSEWLSLPMHSMSFVECAFGCYMSLLGDMKLCPSTINVYSCGVKFFLKNAHVDLSSLEGSRHVRAVKSGITHTFRLENVDITKASSKTMPANVIMLNEIRFRICADPTNKVHICLSTAIHAAFVYLFRTCEFIYKSDGGGLFHFLREQDVRFTVIDSFGSERIIRSADAHAYETRYRVNKQSVLVDICLNVRDAKNDPEGEGNRYVHRIEGFGENRAFCIASMMFECAIACRPSLDWPFFSCPSERWVLSESQVSRVIKDSAKRFFSAAIIRKFTIRSCRVGGASALLNAKAPDSYVKQAGRWKSNAFLLYLRVSADLCHAQTALMCQIDAGVSIESINKLMPIGTLNASHR